MSEPAVVAKLSAYLRRHAWVLGTGTTAAAVFLVTFVAVSASTDGSGDTTNALLGPIEGDVVADAEPSGEPVAAEEQAEQTVLEQTGPEATINATRPAPTNIPEAQQQVPEPDPIPIPEFDEADLIHGGTGAQGAILAGVGIVRSSGVDRQTPWELIVPSARIKASIVKVGVAPGNAFGAPDNPDVIGWWETGPAPGEAGNVLLDGHRDFSDLDDNVGTGVCWSLPQTEVGDSILIRDNEAGVFHIYEVSEIASVLWNDPSGVRFLEPTIEPSLTLITCEGSFDGEAHNYSNRRIVKARFIGTTPIPAS